MPKKRTVHSPFTITRDELLTDSPEVVWDRLCAADPLGFAAGGDSLQWTYRQELAGMLEPKSGPLRRLWAGIALERAGELGTRVRLFLEVTPSDRWPLSVAKLSAKRLMESVFSACRHHPVAAPPPMFWRRALTRFRLRAFEAGGPKTAPLVDNLKAYLIGEPDPAVQRIEPAFLASLWGADRHEVTRLCLFAAKIGVLEKSWELLCSQCRLPRARVPSVDRVPLFFHCPDCRADSPGDLARHVDLVFRVAPGIRRTSEAVARGIATSRQPAILARRPLPAYARSTMALTLIDEHLRLRSVADQQLCRVWPVPKLDPQRSRALLRLDGDGWAPKGLLFRPGAVTLELANETPIETTIRLERATPAPHRLSAASALVFPGFREIFPRESPELPMSAGALCFLALDVKETPALFETLGEEAAHAVIGAIERRLVDAVHRSCGSVLRRPAEASLLAVFADPASGFAAALEAIAAVDSERRYHDLPFPLFARAGIHVGPAAAARREGCLELVGHPPHRARAFLREGQGGDLVFPPDLLELPRVRSMLKQRRAALFSFTTAIVDIGGTHRLCRAIPASASAPTKLRAA